MSGRLFVVGTPIGNLEDITFRAVKVLREVHVVACEDTRRARILFQHYGIDTPTISYNEHNEHRRIPELIERLRNGEDIALLSDAGMPTISDPGYRLVHAVREAGMEVVSVPGPSAVTAALSVSGLPTDRFIFEGFLPRKKGKREKKLLEIRDEVRTVVIFESVHRIERTLQEMLEVLGPDRKIAVCRELTKMFEEVLYGRIEDVLRDFRVKKGEFVVVIGGKDVE